MRGQARTRPRVFYGWYIVASSMAANAILSAAYFQGFSAFFLPIESHFGWGRSAISAAASLRQVETGVLGPAVGLLVDRFSPRKLIVAGAVVCGVGLIGLGLVNSLATFFFFFLLISVGSSAVGHGVTWPTLIARWFRRKRGLAIGLAVNGPLFAGPMVVANTALIAAFGWRPILIGYGVVVLIVVTALGLVARDRPEAYGMLPDGDAPQGAPGARPTPAQLRAAARSAEAGLTLRQVLRSRAFWLLSFYLGAMFIVNSGFQLPPDPLLRQRPRLQRGGGGGHRRHRRIRQRRRQDGDGLAAGQGGLPPCADRRGADDGAGVRVSPTVAH